MSTVENSSKSKIKWGLLFPGLFVLVILVWIGLRIIFPDSATIFAATPPDNIGVKAGKLADCPTTLNCIGSQNQDSEHNIDPIAYDSKSHPAPIAEIKDILLSFDRGKIIEASDRYLHAEFTSHWFGFVDDVEFYLNEDSGVIEVRSAARLGESDLGVNRQRMENVRAKFSNYNS